MFLHLRDLLAQIEPFPINIGYLSHFFSHLNTGLIWVGVESLGQLENLHKQLTKKLNKSGWSLSEKKLVPHITLGRLKKVRRDDKMRILDHLTDFEFADNLGGFTVTEMQVLTSQFQKGVNSTEYKVLKNLSVGNDSGKDTGLG